MNTGLEEEHHVPVTEGRAVIPVAHRGNGDEGSKVLHKMQPARARHIREAIGYVAADPFTPNNNVKALRGVRNGYRIRVGDWRGSYVIDRTLQTLSVFEIAPRGGAYR